MKVLKFGGTSVGTVKSLENVRSIIESLDEDAVIVVSALGGITDRLIATAKAAAEGQEEKYKSSFAEIRERHDQVINGMVPVESRQEVTHVVDEMLLDLERLYYGIYLVNDLSERVLDRVVSFGERLSSAIICRIIDGISLLDSRMFIKTVKKHGRHVLDHKLTSEKIREHFEKADARLILVPGFISTDRNGDVTNLGRGGSDYTAAILAAELDADQLEIWTDVDGFLTGDPRKIKDTKIIDNMSFVEAMELCNFGAKVIYPPTIYPVFHKNIPVYIKNTFNPKVPGTLISDRENHISGKVSGISSLGDTCLLLLRVKDQHITNENVKARVFNSLNRKGVDVFMSCPSEFAGELIFAVRNSDSGKAIDELELEFGPEISGDKIEVRIPQPNMATIALVGENLADPAGLLRKIKQILKDSSLNISAASIGESGCNVSVVVSLDDEVKALQRLHEEMF